jgi:glycosidase
LVEGSLQLDLASHLVEPLSDVAFQVEVDAPVVASVTDAGQLLVDAPSNFVGEATMYLTATSACGGSDQVEVQIRTEQGSDASGCWTQFVYDAREGVVAVSLAGSFNDWSTEAHRMERVEGQWVVSLPLEPGAYPYKFIERAEARFDAEELWVCDPQASFIQCDSDYPGPGSTSWTHACEVGGLSCNSMRVVESCDRPTLEVTRVDQDNSVGSVTLNVEATAGAEDLEGAEAWLDGEPLQGVWSGTGFDVVAEGLTPGRHTFRFRVTDASGRTSDEAYVPVWTDDWSWDEAVVYFAFVDRVANGDPSNDGKVGATAELGEYQGGDYAGLTGMLPYLADMGVNVLWLSNPGDNPEGAWSGDCDATYSGYHAYWPSSSTEVEEHFGGEGALKTLIDEAHGLHMRVMMDWVANHVHEDHPYWEAHPEWFHDLQICSHEVDGQLNFDRIPETCWFAPYLPDIDYTLSAPLYQSVEDALGWVKTYGFDGFRVDAVKHVNHAVPYNLTAMLEREVEHRAAGSDTRFWTVGETFDTAERIAAYIGDQQLDGQFDFPLYYALRDAFIHDRMSLPDLMATVEASEEVYGDAQMASFLGNHDVDRWMTESIEGEQEVCVDGSHLQTALIWADESDAQAHFDRMALAWTWMFTQRFAPLIYYGDELGMPGYGDPDNRQPLWWYLEDPSNLTSVDEAAATLPGPPAGLVHQVASLARARGEHASFYRGDTINWWQDEAVYAYARSWDGDHMLALFNRQDVDVVLSNGLAFAGLPSDASYIDVLTSEVFLATGDQIDVPLSARQARVLVVR